MKKLKSKKGMTLIEALCALLIVAFGTIMLSVAAGTAAKSMETAKPLRSRNEAAMDKYVVAGNGDKTGTDVSIGNDDITIKCDLNTFTAEVGGESYEIYDFSAE